MALETSAILKEAIAKHDGAIQETLDHVRSLMEHEPNAWRALSILRRRNKPGSKRFIYERNGFVHTGVGPVQGPPANKVSMCTGTMYPGEKRACGNVRIERNTSPVFRERSAEVLCDCGQNNLFTFDRPPNDIEIAHAVASMVKYHRERIPAA